MKSWIDLSTVEMPARIASMSRDARGYPIPYTVHFFEDGRPDFRVIDPEKWMRAARLRCCGICGQTLGGRVAFVGGPGSMESRAFTDLPMHRDCAIYALQVCPFIAAPKFAYTRSLPEGTKASDNVSVTRPERFGLGITKGYELLNYRGEVILRAKEFESIEWWRHGRVEQSKQEETGSLSSA